MNGIFILVTIAVYFGILLLVAHITSVRSSDNDAFSGATASRRGTLCRSV